MILVTGASGNVGTALLRHLRAIGAPVRAGSRRPAADGVLLDLDRPETLGPALDGVDTVFLLGPTGPDQTRQELNLVQAARAVDARIVKLSVWRANEGLSPIARLHRPVEEALAGTRHTLLRPNFYMQNFLRQPGIRAAGRFGTPLIMAPVSFVDVDDIAAVAAHVLTTDGHDGRVYDITGPQALTYEDAAAVFTEVLGKPVRYEGWTDEQARATMLDRGMPEFYVDALIDVARAYRHGGAETVTSTVKELTGRDATGLADFIRRHRDVFG
jgi:uncharacterized protein YbjT (DUF2867 family)